MKEVHLMQNRAANAAHNSPGHDLGDLRHVGFVATFDADGSAGAFQPQVSADGTNWADLGSTTSGANTASVAFDLEVKQRYLRVAWDGNGVAGNFDLRMSVKEHPIKGA